MSKLQDLFTKNLGTLDHLTEEAKGEKKPYIQPTRRNLGNVSIVLLREVIAPTIFRNEEPTPTEIEVPGLASARLRATPNKFKYVERGVGLQVLRAYKVGGRFAQNRTVIDGGPGKSFDLNTVVFGDSAMDGNRVLPVKAAVNYSDALSLAPAITAQTVTMHHLSAEEGTLYDVETGKNSVNLFERHVIKPGTLLVQVLTIRGKGLTPSGFNHLLLSLGLGGTYGGQTSVTGTNLRTHLVGAYGGPFEQPESSPYVLLKALGEDAGELSVSEAIAAMDAVLSPVYAQSVGAEELEAYRKSLVERFLQEDPTLEQEYQEAANKYAEYFDRYFESPAPKAGKGKGKGKSAEPFSDPTDAEAVEDEGEGA